ncbi:MAG: hypothetical protein Q8L85_08730 [Alphaproteobacteria bacterium]|nr:hypothetical protein [Alphaproteobacteria bacterium]
MKLKIYSIALLTLLNFTVNAAGNDDDNDDIKLGKRKKFETTEDENVTKIFCTTEENIVIDNQENNNNIIVDNEYSNEIDDTEYEDPVDDGSYFHDRYQNPYYSLNDQEKVQKRIHLLAKIDVINTAFNNGTIDKATRRKNIIKAVSESFNIKLLSHFGYVSQAESDDYYDPSNEINTNDIINPSDDFDINDDYIEYLNYRSFHEDEIELVKNFEYFSLSNMNFSYLHPETFNELLIYFPWIKKIFCYFGCDETDYELKVFNKINALFSNIEHLKKIENITLSNTKNTRICFSTSDLPEWAHKIKFDVYC